MQSKFNRNIVYIAMTMVPVFYVVLMVLLWSDTNIGINGYINSFYILLISVLVSIILNGSIVLKRWNDEVDQKQMSKDIIMGALFQLPSFGGLLYCILQIVN